MRPLSSTIWSGSASETLRVRLLSSPHAAQAPRIASGPSRSDKVGCPDPSEHGGARDQARHAERNPPIEILTKDEPDHQIAVARVLASSTADITVVSALALSGTLMEPLPWQFLAAILAGAAGFALILDQIKLAVMSVFKIE